MNKDLRWHLPPYTGGVGIAISQMPYKKIFPHMITVNEEPIHFDNPETGQVEYYNPDMPVKSIDNLDVFSTRSMNFVFVDMFYSKYDLDKVLTEYWRVIKNQGHLCVMINNNDPTMIEKLSKLKDAQIIDTASWTEQVTNPETNEEMEIGQHLFVVLKSKIPFKKVPEGTKTACVIRYGAFGDLLRASSVCAGLKKQGYHVTLMCQPPGVDIVTNDPNIDRLSVTMKDQVPNAALGAYWEYQSTLYDKFVNLSESEEGTLLELPGRPGPSWPPEVREKYRSTNYMEFQHEIARLPHDPQIRFYPTTDEKVWANAERAKIKTKGVLVWQLAGSSVHKVWNGEVENGMDQFFARVLSTFKDISIVITGGDYPPIDLSQWENESRVVDTRGKWNIRQTLTFVQDADIVIGPETGVMNSVCQFPNEKIIFLSHSTVENLTRDWINTTSLIAPEVTCPGRGKNNAMACHQIHYGWDNCKQNQITGTAECQANITVDMLWDAFEVVAGKLNFKPSIWYLKNIKGQ
jgi:hypothetical protein